MIVILAILINIFYIVSNIAFTASVVGRANFHALVSNKASVAVSATFVHTHTFMIDSVHRVISLAE